MICHAKTNAQRHGFTLIELLVVISIISLLISILLPVLSRARSTAVTLQCSNFQRQVMQGFFFYATDNKGVFPAMGDGGNSLGSDTNPFTAGIWGSWVGRLMATNSIPVNVKGTNKQPTLAGSANISTGLLGCPVTPLVSAYGNVSGVTGFPTNPWQNIGTSYGLNWQMFRTTYHQKVLGKAGSNHYVPVNPDLIPRASTTIVMGDHAWKGNATATFRLQRKGAKVSDSNLVNNEETVDFRHGTDFKYGNQAGTVQYVNYNGVANISYFDGHVAGKRDEDIKVNAHSMWTSGL